MSLATWAALPTSVWTRMYASTTGTHLLASCRRGALQSLVPRGWWHAAAGSGDHVARTCCSPPMTGWLLGGPAYEAQEPAAPDRVTGAVLAGRDPGRQAAPGRPSRPAG